MKSITAILQNIDQLSVTKLDERQVAAQISQYIEAQDNKVDKTIHWEKAAFEFYANYRNKETGWGTYFGPMYIWPNGKGRSVEYPSIQMVSEKVLSYYALRSEAAINPILVARYAGLVYDFFKHVTGKPTPYSIKLIYIQSLIATANGDYHLSPVYTFEKLTRALTIALQIKNKELVNAAKVALIAFEKRHAEDQYAGLWGSSFEYLLLKNRAQKLVSTDEENDLISDMAQRFMRLKVSVEDKQLAYRNLEQAGSYLFSYYRIRGENDKLNDTTKQIIDHIELSISDLPPGAKKAAEYERLYELCKKFKMKARGDGYLKIIRELGQKAHDDMKVFAFESSVSAKELQAFGNKLLKGPFKEIFQRVAYSFVPNFALIKKQIEKDRRNNPFPYIVTKRLVDRKGRTKAIVKPFTNDPEGHIFNEASRQMKIKPAICLDFILKKLISEMDFNPSDIINALIGSPVVSPSRFSILEAGVNAYIKGDYLVSIHLIVPQLEEALRNTLEINGGVILNFNEDGSSFVKTLDSVLRDDITVRVLTEEITNYFRLLLTDQRGWNLRNDVCHGLAEPEEFNKIVADRVIHALFCIANIRYKSDESKSE